MMNVKFSDIESWFTRQNYQLLHEKWSFNNLYTYLWKSVFLSVFEAHNFMHSYEQLSSLMSTNGMYLCIYNTKYIHNCSDDNLSVASTLYKIGFYNHYLQIFIVHITTRTVGIRSDNLQHHRVRRYPFSHCCSHIYLKTSRL